MFPSQPTANINLSLEDVNSLELSLNMNLSNSYINPSYEGPNPQINPPYDGSGPGFNPPYGGQGKVINSENTGIISIFWWPTIFQWRWLGL
jgi:hypothetical protein